MLNSVVIISTPLYLRGAIFFVDTLYSIQNMKHHTITVLRPFVRDHPGEPVPEENFWTLWCKRRLTEADTLTIRLGATPSGLTSAHLPHPPIQLVSWSLTSLFSTNMAISEMNPPIQNRKVPDLLLYIPKMCMVTPSGNRCRKKSFLLGTFDTQSSSVRSTKKETSLT